MSDIAELTVVQKQILVSGALRYSKTNWGKPDYYKNPIGDYIDQSNNNDNDDGIKWFFEETFIDTEDRSEPVKPSFTKTVIDYIDSHKLTDVAVFSKAGIEKNIYSKMVNAPDYKPSKDMCIALCFALKVDATTAQTMLSHAGYSLTHENKRDLYIEFLFTEDVGDPAIANEVLSELGEKKLMEM